ncbi:uncharacterized protein [Henckelia pumila]|uniref:uncharacterized protein n=1 Tax=Henckelia pumila TaxID=405737 RepID=UPI003C6DBB81
MLNSEFMNIKFLRAEEDDRQSRSDNEVEQAPVQNSLESWLHCIRGQGQAFKNATEFRTYIKNYSVATRRSFCYNKNDSKKINVVCSEVNCKWRIYASRHKADNLFGIRKCNLQLTCGEDNLCGRGHPRADATWVANLMKEKLRAKPSYRPYLLLKDIRRDYGVELEYRKVWKGKELAMHDIYGTEKDCYDKLRWYCSNVRETNSGSVAEYEIDALTNKFKRLFICFNVFAGGFATDLDAKNDCNWEWFCINLKSVLLSQHIRGFENFTFFSDRHSGIIKVMRSYPLHNKTHWSFVFKKPAYAPSHQEFMQHINNISEYMPLARKFITNSEPESWANALFRGKHWGVMNNNMAECWNNWVKPARYLPIVGMVDRIRVQIMNMIHQRRETTFAMVQELRTKKEKTLTINGDKTFAVDLNDWSCSCRAWEINMLSCKHSCAAIKSKYLSLYSFCDRYFHIDMYRQAYKGIINLIPTFDMNEDSISEGSIINAPDVRSQPGRRKTKRIPSQVETRVAKCGHCRKRGHNRRSCKEAIE